MTSVRQFGELTSSSFGIGPLPPFNFDLINQLAQATAGGDAQVIQRAITGQRNARSLWFLNFPTQTLLSQNAAKYEQYMQNILDYRSWASLIWNRTVYTSTQIPQDSSKASQAIQNAYLARVAVHHMKTTPWYV